MSKTTITRIICDDTGCNRTIDIGGAVTAGHIVGALERYGWAETVNGVGHLCADHSPVRRVVVNSMIEQLRSTVAEGRTDIWFNRSGMKSLLAEIDELRR